MKSSMMILALMAVLSCSTATADITQAVPMTHMELQAVDEYGDTIYNGPEWIIVEGILLNNPEEWLDPMPSAPVPMGGQWQIIIQGEGNDEAGTACWMGQKYGSLGLVPPEKSYTDAEWLDELYRLNYDPNSVLGDRPHVFRAGDRVRVTGRSLFRNGKRLINERHNNDPSADFVLELIKPAVGLPQPIEITLEDLKDASNAFIFGNDPCAGGELYQSRRVRLENVYIINPEKWGTDDKLIVADSPSGWTRSFEVELGRGEGIFRYPAPESTDKIDVIGIMNQDSGNWVDGYSIFALNYDGSRRVLGDAQNLRGNLPGDINNDFIINLQDFAELAEHWLREMPGLYPRP